MVKARRKRLFSITARAIPALVVSAAGIMLAVSSCGSPKPPGGTDQAESVKRPADVREPVPVGHCRIIGTVLEVHAPDPKIAGEDLCSKYPCRASVRVDSILGYGSGFPGALGPGQMIEARFEYTLAPSKEAYPGAAFTLPGLAPGDRFQADLSGGAEMLRSVPGGERTRYGVALYKLLR